MMSARGGEGSVQQHEVLLWPPIVRSWKRTRRSVLSANAADTLITSGSSSLSALSLTIIALIVLAPTSPASEVPIDAFFYSPRTIFLPSASANPFKSRWRFNALFRRRRRNKNFSCTSVNLILYHTRTATDVVTATICCCVYKSTPLATIHSRRESEKRETKYYRGGMKNCLGTVCWKVFRKIQFPPRTRFFLGTFLR